MKCQYCNATLSFEEEVCPHCGRKNMHAQMHIKDMLHYQDEFENTKQDVQETTKNYSRNMVQLIIITVLVVVTVIMMFVCASVDDFYYDYMEKKAEKNVAEYTAIIQQYVEDENFRKLYLFCDENYIFGYSDVYSSYVPIIRGAEEYTYFCDSLIGFMNSTDSNQEHEVQWICNYLNDFYDCMDMSNYEYYRNADRKENEEVLERMELDIKRMLQSYCYFTQEEVDQLRQLSEAKRTVLIEEKLLYED